MKLVLEAILIAILASMAAVRQLGYLQLGLESTTTGALEQCDGRCIVSKLARPTTDFGLVSPA